MLYSGEIFSLQIEEIFKFTLARTFHYKYKIQGHRVDMPTTVQPKIKRILNGVGNDMNNYCHEKYIKVTQ